MAFRYNLEALLRLRLSEERQEELRLRALSSAVARLRGELQELEEARFERRRGVQEKLERGGAASLLHYDATCDATYTEKRAAVRHELDCAQTQRRKQLDAYQAARRRSEILRVLRQHRLDDYNLELLRREQQLFDEAFLIRHFVHSGE